MTMKITKKREKIYFLSFYFPVAEYFQALGKDWAEKPVTETLKSLEEPVN